MATLLQDIGTQSAWIVKAFGADKLKLDYSLESLRLIDDFFDKHSENGSAKPNGRLSQNRGPILFSIGSYVGETVIRNVPGSLWVTDDKDPQGEITAEIHLPNGTIIWPIQKVIKRFQEGQEDSIYAYGAVVIKDMSQGDFWEKAKNESVRKKLNSSVVRKKPWWKFW